MNHVSLFGDFINSLVLDQRDSIEKKHLDQFKIRWIESIDYEDHEINVFCRGGEMISVPQQEYLDWYNAVQDDRLGPLTQENIDARWNDQDFLIYLQIEKGYSRTEFA